MLTVTLLCLVVGISDGDTLTARCGAPGQYEQVKVRLQGIDAPERKQPFGERARQALAELTFQKEAALYQDRPLQATSVLCLGCSRISPDRAADTRCRPSHDHARHGLVVSRLCPRTVPAGARAIRIC